MKIQKNYNNFKRAISGQLENILFSTGPLVAFFPKNFTKFLTWIAREEGVHVSGIQTWISRVKDEHSHQLTTTTTTAPVGKTFLNQVQMSRV